MSSVIKGVGKVFKKVVKTVVKIAPYALAAAAALYTGGAALGLAPMAGGWGAAASAMTAKLGAGGVLSSVMTGAITQAGYGALAGGVITEIGGGSFTKGMKSGALMGAATGGLSGGLKAMSATTDLAKKAGQVQQTGQTAANKAASQTATQASQSAGKNVATNAATQAGNPVAKVGVEGTSGGLFSKGGWIERNQQLAGSVITGLGQGLSADANVDAEKELLREKYRRIAQNYEGADPSAGFRAFASGQSSQSPTQRFDQRIYGDFEYQYNPKTGRIERVALQGA